ncbi:chromosomal replication initiator protein dnaA [Candidatus Kinetoplastibacterium blastocrithidii TCC012E]|uniref:Chromosomal replication initiator protein DnaA n=1 Tax=Candidatus Kinetoplastidibacterium blastocrithidiae TCC012E TaxID=1208922 RepID=M1M2N0_9PROT|nr:chromosomal replication initiator protein DnaA [Candidatus Kinetoplastibacterium blastocrithidii]AFZ83356.1 chromosomal replication initiator protein [Candidatus Kinetoplastibacterium blastocrithidii (ex Strigomonas culicis)]AGF49454.1 chromosomal replication initiator protein dnaA [Candidatus Kinetoplastibacterium blastocrithidii TCC012E]
MEDFWLSFISSLEKELPPQQISAWIKPLIPVAFDESKSILRIMAPNRFKLDLVKKKFASQIEVLASDWFKKSVNVVFELPANGERSIQRKNDTSSSDVDNDPYEKKSGSNSSTIAPKIELATSHEVANIAYERSRLNTVLTFDGFVTGKANQLARAAAVQVSENPGVSYNPLFLYGGVGLGKTHLIHAVGNSMLFARSDVRVRYVHADQYVSDVVKAYQRKAFDEFKKYYHSLDLLLIDDIQFFSGKNRTQEEFFYAFEAMVAQHKQIIITSDTYPKELSGIDSRLISRFDSGLTVAIEPPELEMRVAILLRKAESENLPMPEEVAFFIAKHLRSNVRELEGALRKVLAYIRFHGRNVLTVDVCKEALKDLLSVSNGQITVENIQKTVADYYKIKVADMYSKRRPANIALPRQIAMYLSKELTQKSLPEIGDLFGGRDHTTVLHAVRKISDARIKQSELNHNLHVLEQTLKG